MFHLRQNILRRLLFIIFFFLHFEKGSCYVEEVDLKLEAILLPQPHGYLGLQIEIIV